MNRFFDKLPIVGKKIPGKITLSFLIFLFSLIMLIVFKTFSRKLCAIAMFFSFIGDIALNHNRKHSKQTIKDVLIGGIAFIVAHFFYCAAYYGKILDNGYKYINFGAIIAFLILFYVTFILSISIKVKNTHKILIFGLVYLWLTGINYITIFSYAFSSMSIQSVVAVGGLMILLSDIIIEFEKICGLRSETARELVWWFYPIGQIILIAMA